MVKHLPSAGDPGSIPGLGRSPGEGNGNPLQYSCLENSMDRPWDCRVRHDWVVNTFTFRDFSGDSMVNNPPSNSGDVGSIPAQGTKIPHAVGQLSLHATPKTQHSQKRRKKKKEKKTTMESSRGCVTKEIEIRNLKKNLHCHAYCSIIHSSWDMEQHKCPLVDEWIKNTCYLQIMEWYSTLKKKEITPFDSTWMNLENIILSELSQTPEGKNTAWYHFYLESKIVKLIDTERAEWRLLGTGGRGWWGDVGQRIQMLCSASWISFIVLYTPQCL